MAYCKHCGSKLEDGAKFCPKCGKSTSEEIIKSQQEDGREEVQSGKSGCMKKLLYGFIALCVVGYIANKCSGGDDSKASDDANTPQATEQVDKETPNVDEEQVRQQKEEEERIAREKQEEEAKQSKTKDIEEQAYKAGYQAGFTVGPASYITDDPKRKGRIYYTTYYSAPMNDEEKAMCNLFIEHYVRGYEDGHKAQQQ